MDQGCQRTLLCFISAALLAYVLLFVQSSEDQISLVSDSIVLFGNDSFIFNELINSTLLSLLFPWFHSVKPYDRRLLQPEKLFEGRLYIPLVGVFVSCIKLKQLEAPQLLVFDGDNFLEPSFVVRLTPVVNRMDRSLLQIEVLSRRSSHFFNILVKPIFRFVLYHQLKHRLFTLQYSVQKLFDKQQPNSS